MHLQRIPRVLHGWVLIPSAIALFSSLIVTGQSLAWLDSSAELQTAFAPAVAPSVPAAATGDEPQAFVSIATYSDIFEPTEGVPVYIEDGTSGNTLSTTDSTGQTTFVPSTLGATLVVTLGEHWTSQGVLIGQQRIVTMPWSPNPSDKTFLLHETTQPLALPFEWPPKAGEDSVSADPYHSRWTLREILGGPNPVAFSGLAAPLLMRREIDSVLAYNGAPETSDLSNFRVGTLLRTDVVDLLYGAFTLEIDCRGHGFTAPPVASCIIIANKDQADPPTLSAQVVDWDGETARVWLSGSLEAGDNLILLSPGPNGDPTVRYMANPPYFGDAAGPDAAGDCVPPAPAPPADWICDAPNPKSDAGCFEASNVGIWCDTNTKRISDIACGSSGSSESVTEESQKGFSFSIMIKIKGVEITPTGFYVDVDSSTSTIGFGDGEHGCGECKAKYRHHLICIEAWDIEKRVRSFSWSEWTWMTSCDRQRKYPKCTDQMTSEGVCSRTCN